MYKNISGSSAYTINPFSWQQPESIIFSRWWSGTVFRCTPFEGSASIYEISASGGKPKRLTNWTKCRVQQAYAPDGNSFVFVSDRAGFNKTTNLIAMILTHNKRARYQTVDMRPVLNSAVTAHKLPS